MSDLISRQAAIDALNKLDVSDGVGISSIACDLQEEAIRSIKSLPSAQPEIIRCKDCKFAHLTYDGMCKYCDMMKDDDDRYLEMYVDGDFFCGFAERRQDEQNSDDGV